MFVQPPDPTTLAGQVSNRAAENSTVSCRARTLSLKAHRLRKKVHGASRRNDTPP